MISLSELSPRQKAEYGFARARDVAFDAIYDLWQRRRKEGLKQIDIATAIDWDPSRVSKSLSGPGNWTLHTFGALIEALNGEVEIIVHAAEDSPAAPLNYSAYDGYGAVGHQNNFLSQVKGRSIGPPVPQEAQSSGQGKVIGG